MFYDQMTLVLSEAQSKHDLKGLAQGMRHIAELLERASQDEDPANEARSSLQLLAKASRALSGDHEPLSLSVTGTSLPFDVEQMTGREAIDYIFQEGLEFSHSRYRDLFHRWWHALDDGMQKKLAIAAEGFASWRDYQIQRQSFSFHSPPSLSSSRTAHKVGVMEASTWQEWLRSSLLADLAGHEASLAQLGAGILRTGSLRLADRKTLDAIVKDIGKQYKETFLRLLNITIKGRPMANEARHREFSKLKYEGRTWKDIADIAQTKYSLYLDESSVEKTVMHYRKIRQDLVWAVRVWVFFTNFPEVHDPCNNCAGRGNVPNPTWSEWHDWRSRQVAEQLRRAEGERYDHEQLRSSYESSGAEPPKSGLPTITCSACAGRGFRHPLLPDSHAA